MSQQAKVSLTTGPNRVDVLLNIGAHGPRCSQLGFSLTVQEARDFSASLSKAADVAHAKAVEYAKSA